MPGRDEGKRRQGHYFSRSPEAEAHPRELFVRLRGREFRLRTDAGTFSPDHIDKGTMLLIETMELPASGLFLDWGCGYGPIGIVAAALSPDAFVMLAEVNERAVACARENLHLNHIGNAWVCSGDFLEIAPDYTYDVILTNPPVRMGNEVVFRLIRESALSLRPGGSFWLVGRKQQGIATIARRAAEHFGQVETIAVKSGYRVLRAREPRYE